MAAFRAFRVLGHWVFADFAISGSQPRERVGEEPSLQDLVEFGDAVVNDFR